MGRDLEREGERPRQKRKEELRERGSAGAGAQPPPLYMPGDFLLGLHPHLPSPAPLGHTPQYLRGLGTDGHQGHARQFLPDLHGSGWGTRRAS